MTPSVRVSFHTSSAGLLLGMLSLTGCGAASDAVRGMSGAGSTNAVSAGSGGDSGAGSGGGGTSAGGGGTSGGGASGSGGGAPAPSGGAPSGPSSSRHVARPV